jgi:hypothetical protein
MKAIEGSPSSDEAREAAVVDDGEAQQHQYLYLLGRPTLRQYLRFVDSHAVAAPGHGALTDRWRAGLAQVEALERDEAGAADHATTSKLGPEFEPLLVELLQDPLVRDNFNTVPTDIAWVELDRLVVYQKHIDLSHAQRIQQRLGPAPTPEQVFRTCLPHDHPRPPVRWARVHRDRYVFVSPSNDLRVLTTRQLQWEQLRDVSPPGDVVGMVALAVGFGANFLNAILCDGRLLLDNGSHRAYALRQLGVTHVPCIVQHPASREELLVIAPGDVRAEPDTYLTHRRPPMLKDYFDPKLIDVFEAYRRLRQVTVSFQIEENSLPAL